MSIKTILPLVILILALLGLPAYLLLSNQSATEASSPTEEEPWFVCIPEESYFDGYTISGDQIQFRYSICFKNSSEDDLRVSSLCAGFKKSELKGWLKYEDTYMGVLEDGSYEAVIHAGEKVNIVFVFTGEYLGGTVEENLSFPSMSYCLK